MFFSEADKYSNYKFCICFTEQEADAEVERQRKEKERQQNQDKMTLGETRNQICNLENRLKVHKEEKHQLFLQLKKVLNEDDNRRRQLVKESKQVHMMNAIIYLLQGSFNQYRDPT